MAKRRQNIQARRSSPFEQEGATGDPDKKKSVWSRVGGAFATLGIVITTSTGVAVIFASLFMLYQKVYIPTIVILPISDSKSMQDIGYTPDALAQRISASIKDVSAKARSYRRSVDAAPQSELPNITFAQSGLSLETIANEIRIAIKKDNRWTISGDVIVDKSRYNFNLVITKGNAHYKVTLKGNMREFESVFESLATGILNITDPYILAAFLSDTDPTRATSILKKLILTSHEADEIMPWAYNLIGTITNNYLRDKDEAMVYYQRAIDINPRFLLGHINKAILFAEQPGKEDEALSEIDTAFKIDGSTPYPYAARGVLRNFQKRLSDAEKDFVSAIDLDPEWSHSHALLGQSLYYRGDIEGARTRLKVAIELNPEEKMAYNLLGNMLYDEKNYPEAEIKYKMVLKRDPFDANIHANLGRALFFQRKFADAQAEFMRAIELNPNVEAWHKELAEVLKEQEKNVAEITAQFKLHRQLKEK
jgi:tetratricopeptide (TPR) repeat protein